MERVMKTNVNYVREKDKRTIVLIVYIILGAGLTFLFFKFLFKPLLPFFIAWATALFLRPMIMGVHRVTGIPAKFLGIFFSLLFICAAISGVALICGTAATELRGLLASVGENADSVLTDVFAFFESIRERLPGFLGEGNGRTAVVLRDAIGDMVDGGVKSLTDKIPAKAFEMVSALPGILFFSVVLIIATVYMCADLSSFNSFVSTLVPPKAYSVLRRIKNGIVDTAGTFIRGYLIIMLITFAELSVGFMILNVPYPFIIAAAVAFVDLLPILGTGSVLIPWAIVLFIQGNYGVGLGILVLYSVVTVVRQIIEPKILGSSLGLPPVVVLISAYVGSQLFGLSGVLLLPMAVAAVVPRIPVFLNGGASATLGEAEKDRKGNGNALR